MLYTYIKDFIVFSLYVSFRRLLNKVWFLAAKIAADVFTLKERFILVEVLVGKKIQPRSQGFFPYKMGRAGMTVISLP